MKEIIIVNMSAGFIGYKGKYDYISYFPSSWAESNAFKNGYNYFPPFAIGVDVIKHIIQENKVVFIDTTVKPGAKYSTAQRLGITTFVWCLNRALHGTKEIYTYFKKGYRVYNLLEDKNSKALNLSTFWAAYTYSDNYISFLRKVIRLFNNELYHEKDKWFYIGYDSNIQLKCYNISKNEKLKKLNDNYKELAKHIATLENRNMFLIP